MQKTALLPYALTPYSFMMCNHYFVFYVFLWVVIKDNTNNTNNNNTIKICNNFMSCILSCIFISCIFMPRYLVRRFHVLSVSRASLESQEFQARKRVVTGCLLKV